MPPKHFTRKELIELRDRANALAMSSGVNPTWVRAYVQLSLAADYLDAMLARSTVDQARGICLTETQDAPDANDSGKDKGRSQGCPHSGG